MARASGASVRAHRIDDFRAQCVGVVETGGEFVVHIRGVRRFGVGRPGCCLTIARLFHTEYMLTVAVMMLARYPEAPIIHRIGPLVSALNVVGIICARSWIIDSFPSIWKLIVMTFAWAFGLGQPVQGVQPSGCSRIVIDIENPIADTIICLLPTRRQRLATCWYHHFV